jgi:hypothetical protein
VLDIGFVEAGIVTPDLDEVPRYDELAVQVATGNRVGLHPATLSLANHMPGIVFRRVVEPSLYETICVLTRLPAQHPDTDTVLNALTHAAAELDGSRLDPLLTPGPIVRPIPTVPSEFGR